MSIFDKLLGRSPESPTASATAISQPSISIKYDKKLMKKVDGGYLLLGSNRTLLSSDLESLNPLLDESRRLVRGMPGHKIDAKKLVFTEKFDNGTRKNVLLKFTPPTSSGRRPKYPIEILFTVNISEDFFGTVYYGQSGVIEKAEIILWKARTSFAVNLKVVDGNLVVNQIFKTNPKTFERVKVYQR